MSIDDFLKLPQSPASAVYAQMTAAGDAAGATAYHKAYFERHGVRLVLVAARAADQEESKRALAALVQRTRTSVAKVLGSWKTCKHCASRVKAAASVCRYCQRDLA